MCIYIYAYDPITYELCHVNTWKSSHIVMKSTSHSRFPWHNFHNLQCSSFPHVSSHELASGWPIDGPSALQSATGASSLHPERPPSQHLIWILWAKDAKWTITCSRWWQSTEPNIFLLPGVELQQYWAPWDEISDAYAIHNVWRCTCSPRDHRDCVPPRRSLPPCAAALRVWPFGTAHRDPGKSLQLETTWAWLSELTYNPLQTILDRWNCRTSIQVYNF